MIRVKYILLIVIASGTLFTSCKKDEIIEPENEFVTLQNFGFLAKDNPSLKSNIYFTNISDQWIGRIPLDVDITDMAASFDSYGSTVTINQVEQISGQTRNDFTDIVTYEVSNGNETKSYQIDAIIYTGIPVLNIYTTNNEEISSKEYYEGSLVVKGGRGFDNLEGEMKIRGRGHSTWYLHPKKPYQIKFEDKSPLLGMPEAKRWVLLAEYSDKSLLRNRLAFEMGYISDLDWTPRCHFAEVFINDEYAGTYNVAEKVEEGDDRADIGNDGYLLEIDTPDHIDDDDIIFYSSKFLFQIKEPEIGTNSPEYDLIVDHIDDFESALFGSNFTDPQTGYRAYIDMESFIDWFLINEIAKNVDAQSYSSIYLTYKPGEKIKMGPLWDFDLGFGNVDYADSQYSEGWWVKYNHYFDRMFQDPYFVNLVKNRYNYFYTNKQYLMQVINDQAQLLRYAQDENNNRWDLYGNYVWPNPVYYNTHIEEVNHLKSWLDVRMDWLNDAFNDM